MADRSKKALSEEDKLDAYIDEGFNDDDYVYTEDEDDNAYPVPDADSVAAAASLHSQKARALKLTGAGGINKAATDINEYATAVYLTAQLCVSGGAQSVKAQIIQTDSGTLRVNDQWVTVVRDALAETQRRVPTIKEAVQGVTSAGGGGGGVEKSSSALREAENAVKILRDKGNKLLGADGVAAMIGLIQTKIDQSYMMAAVVVQTLQERPFLMEVRENSKLPLVQVVGATSRPAAQISHMSAVKLFCRRYNKTDFCSFALTEGKVYEIKRLAFSEREDYHKRSPADILVAIDASCFARMQGYNESMAGLPLIIGLSLKSVLNYGQAPFANPGLSSVLGDLREKLGDELVPKDIEGIVGDPYKRCVDHLMAAARVETKVGLKNKFKSAKKGDDIKLGKGGDQDKLLEKLAKKKVSGSDIGSTPRSRLLFCIKHLILVRDLLREKFQNILKVPGGQQAMKEHIIEVWKKIASPIYWFKVTGQGGHPSLKASSRSGQHKLTEGYKAEFIDPNKSLAMDFLKDPSSKIRVYDAGGGDTKVSFSLIVTLKGESIPLIQIRVKKESYMGSSLKLSGERCAGGICSVGAGGGGGGAGGSGHSGGGASSRRKKKGGSRRKRRKRRSRRKRRHTRKKKHHVRRRRRRKTRRKKY